MFSVAKSSGKPSRLLRSVSTMNSSSSLPTWSDEPITMLPAAASGLSVPAVPPLKNAGGFKKPLSNGIELSDPSALVRAMSSSSIE